MSSKFENNDFDYNFFIISPTKDEIFQLGLYLKPEDNDEYLLVTRHVNENNYYYTGCLLRRNNFIILYTEEDYNQPYLAHEQIDGIPPCVKRSLEMAKENDFWQYVEKITPCFNYLKFYPLKEQLEKNIPYKRNNLIKKI